jgi:hypothetical protein
VDRILDLELAFEIAVSGPARDAAPMGWKVGVRSAQMIGGELNARQANRDLINELFKLRSKATHGSDLSKRDEGKLEETVRRCLTTYGELLSSFLALGRLPDWPSLELEPRRWCLRYGVAPDARSDRAPRGECCPRRSWVLCLSPPASSRFRAEMKEAANCGGLMLFRELPIRAVPARRRARSCAYPWVNCCKIC